MARRNRMSVQKRLRERQKAEKAALKREQRSQRGDSRDMDSLVATQDDLEGYGVVPEEREEPETSDAPKR